MNPQTTTTIETNKRLAIHWLDLISQHKLDELCAITPPHWRMFGGPPNLPAGPEGLRTLFAGFGNVQQSWTIDDVIAEGDKVVVRASNAVLQESFFGIPTQGRWQHFTATFTFQIADGQIATIWRNADDLGRLLQIGAKLVAG